MIRDSQRPYLELLRDRELVLDVGCGRGEFLDLLAEAGISAIGIDLDPTMVARCREKGHRAEQADVVSYLRARPDGSLPAIVSAQLIEHLPYDELREFFALAQRKLKPGGLFIAETVNPHAHLR